MKQKIRSYLVFTSRWYKIIMFIILPLLLPGFQIISSLVFQGTAIPFIVMALILVETLADNWFLGGIQEKGSEKIDYLKTSPRGMEIMRSVLIMDLVRRLVYHAVILGVSWLLTKSFGTSAEAGKLTGLGTLLLALGLSYTLSVVGIFIARFASYIWVNLICGYIGCIAGLVILLVCTSTTFVPVALPDIALAVLGIGISFLMVKIAMLKVEGSYYDK
ncbi:MAG: hypothetical protein NC123_17995 [Butyrivibrio sp.]|nr:hypothetical protein [Acetatifactor muris]MCM1561405.1 hypothetical protein [Butyrivibrio sp.]